MFTRLFGRNCRGWNNLLATENLRLSTKRTQAEKVPQTFSLRRGLGELTDVYEIVWEKLQELK